MYKLLVLPAILLTAAVPTLTQLPEDLVNHLVHLYEIVSFLKPSNAANTQPSILYYIHDKSCLDPEILNLNDMQDYNLTSDKTIKIIVPGWYSDRTSCQEIVQAYAKNTNCTVIQVDWSYYNHIDYMRASLNAKDCGKKLAKFIIELQKKTGIPFDNFHIIGFSLGSHVAGFAGKEIYRKKKRKVNRITALDPAGPLFGTPILVRKSDRIHKSDAKFVDCIHTNEGVFGLSQTVGHADIFMNDGRLQPGCKKYDFLEINPILSVQKYVCSHSRAVTFFSESIGTDGFLATACNSYEDFSKGMCNDTNVVPIGEGISSKTRGKYYCNTNSASPFAKF